MKEYHILIACGNGIATSTVIANRVKNLCEDNGFKVKVQQVKIVTERSSSGWMRQFLWESRRLLLSGFYSCRLRSFWLSCCRGINCCRLRIWR